jgi:nitrite reductase (cytochrome c-552)
MKSLGNQIQKRPWLGWVIFLGTFVLVFLVGVLTYTIIENRTEGQFAYTTTTELDPLEPRSEAWGRYFPRQFDTYNQMADTTFKSKHLSSNRTDLLEENPAFVILFAGYGFSKDYNEARGHYYAITDPRETLRTGGPENPEDGPMPATCWTCKSPDVVRVMDDIGPGAFYEQTFAQMGDEIVNPINCASCHDADDMSLKIALPALAETFDRLGKDIEDATHQEKRSLTCAQCHVEYYFGEDNYLVLPWDEGMTAEDMARYYDDREFADWIHPLSRTPMIKAQHPDYEVFTTGIHAQRGVSCSDCHMPYKSEGGMKFSDHQVQSPLNNISAACQTCHRESEADLVRDVYARQDAVKEVRVKLEDALVKAHLEAEQAWEMGAPLELTRTIGDGLDLAHEARREIAQVLAELGHIGDLQLADVSTKRKAQEYIGIDIDQLEAEKQRFLDNMVPEWLEEAAERHQRWEVNRESDAYEAGNYIRPDAE